MTIQIETDWGFYAPYQFQSWLGEAVLGPHGNLFEIIGWRRDSIHPVMLRRLNDNAPRVTVVEWLYDCTLVVD